MPKAGGMTLSRIIQRQYGNRNVSWIPYNNKAMQNIEKEFRRHPVISIDELLQKFYRQAKKDVQKLPVARKKGLKVLMTGHVPFGLHRYLANHFAYITILRNPIDRVISYYYYATKLQKHYFSLKYSNMSLKDCIISGMSTELNNYQTRLLSDTAHVPFGHLPRETLETAKRNLQEKFSVVGLLEKYDETLILLRRKFGWKFPFYIIKNTTKNRPKRRDIPQDTIDVIEKYNKLDMELYNYAKEIFEKQIGKMHFFRIEVAIFKFLNTLYCQFCSLPDSCSKFMFKLIVYSGPVRHRLYLYRWWRYKNKSDER